MAGLSARYANALFELSIESGTIDDNLEQAIFLRDTLKDEDCQRIIAHPQISTAEKIDFFRKAFAGNIDENLQGMVYLAITKDREEFLIPALSVFIDMINNHKLKTTARVTSAVALSETQISAIRTALSQKLSKQVDIISKVDSEIVGGLTIFVDGYLIDRTLKRKFKDLKENLKVV